MRWWPRSPDRQRREALRAASPGPLRDFLATPPPGPATDLRELRLLAVDLETTGLDVRTASIVSIGFVPVDGLRIELSGARHLLVQGSAPVGQSATFHGLGDDLVAGGLPLPDALAELLQALAGRVLLAHHARIETTFLSVACGRTWGADLPCPAVDTLELERRLTTSAWQPDPREGTLRLSQARRRHGLPTYRAHHALADALACAELYLAQAAEMRAAGPVTAKQVLS